MEVLHYLRVKQTDSVVKGQGESWWKEPGDTRNLEKTYSNSSFCSEPEDTSDFGGEGVSKIASPRHCISSQVGALPVWHRAAQGMGHLITNQAASETGLHHPGSNTKDTGQISHGEHSPAVLLVITALPQSPFLQESIIRNSELEQQMEDFPSEYMARWVLQHYDSRHLAWICCQLVISTFLILSDSEIPHTFKLMQLNLRCDWYKQHFTGMPSSYHPDVLLIILVHHHF